MMYSVLKFNYSSHVLKKVNTPQRQNQQQLLTHKHAHAAVFLMPIHNALLSKEAAGCARTTLQR